LTLRPELCREDSTSHGRPARTEVRPARIGCSGRSDVLGHEARRFRSATRSRSRCGPLGFRSALGSGRAHLVLEPVPEAGAGQGQSQGLRGATARPFPSPKSPRVPIETLPIQHPLMERPMPRLMHP